MRAVASSSFDCIIGIARVGAMAGAMGATNAMLEEHRDSDMAVLIMRSQRLVGGGYNTATLRSLAVCSTFIPGASRLQTRRSS